MHSWSAVLNCFDSICDASALCSPRRARRLALFQNGMLTMTRDCPACAGVGYIDEHDCARLGLPPIVNGCTDLCPACMGSGEAKAQPVTLARLAFEALVLGATALAFGFLVGAAIFVAHRFA